MTTELLSDQIKSGFVVRRLRRVHGVMWRWWRAANKMLVHTVLRIVAPARASGLRLERIGSAYGGWTVPSDLITDRWVCYCVGVGIDATFDMTLTSRFGCEVFSMDPTPKAVAYMAEAEYDRTRLRFLPVGVWKQDAELRFFLPADSRHISNLSMFDLHGTGRYVSATCKKLTSIMKELGHARIDLLKLDIEGAWQDVIDTMILDGVIPRVLCVEMDSPVSLRGVWAAIRKLRGAGLQLIHIEKDNYLFVEVSGIHAASK